MALVNINNEKEFTNNVLKSDKPVLVDFWAPWCGPCKMIAPEVEALATNYEGKALVAKVNVDEQQLLASRFGVMSIPTMVIFKDGQEVTRIVGYKPRNELSAALDNVM